MPDCRELPFPRGIVHYADGHRIVHGPEELAGLKDAISGLLSIVDGADLVLAILPNCPSFVAFAMAAFSRDGDFAIGDTKWPKSVAEQMIADLRPAYLLTMKDQARHYANDMHDIVGEAADLILIQRRAGERQGRPLSADDAVIILFSSGSTGVPKAIAHTRSSLILNAAMHCNSLELTVDHRILVTVSMAYSYGFVAVLLASILTESQLILCENIVFGANVGAISADNRVDVLPCTPFYIKQQLRQEGWRPPDHIQKLMVGGDFLAHPLLEALRKRTAGNLYLTYGLAEAGPRVLTGKVLDDGDYSLSPVDQAVEIITKDTILHVKSPTLMKGYVEFGQLVPIELDSAGFYHTGDIFLPHASGHRFEGRQKNVLSHKGEKINPKHVADILTAHWAVEDARLTWAGLDRKESRLSADIKIDPRAISESGDSKALIQDIRRFCRLQLRAAEFPDSFHIVDSIVSK